MIINVNSDAESSTTGIETSLMAFDFDKQAKLFHMLSSSLYSNKLGSVLRELSSNGRDAMVEAGRPDEPFYIIGPTYENPELVVKDNGVGLTKERAKKTILMYLGSSKDQSADFIGGWGIGSKSPFAYAKNYTVICIKDGMLVEFACWKDDKGMPRDAVIREEKTAAPNGVEMRMPVEASDIRKCNNTIREYMEWTNYAVVATINGENVARREASEFVKTDAYTLKLYEEGEGSVRLVYGGASYKVEDCIDERYELLERWEALKEAIDTNVDVAIVVDTPGAVDFNMNREELEQTERSQSFVNTFVSYMLDVADSQRLTYEDSIDQIRANGKESNLASVEEAITAALTRKNNVDRLFALAFQVVDKKLRYEFKSPQRRITHRSGVQKAHAVEYLIKPLATQIDVAWGRHYSPRPAYRGPVAPSRTAKEHLYVKAESEEEAREILQASKDFAGFDVATLTFIHIDIPIPVRAPTGSVNNQQPNPRPYCRARKAFFQWRPTRVFIMMTGGVSEEDIEYCRFAPGAPRDKVTFTPTPEFIKRHGGHDNVMTDEEFYEKYYDAAVKAVIEFGGVSEKELKYLEKIGTRLQRLVWDANLPPARTKANQDAANFVEETRRVLAKFSDAKLPDGEDFANPHLRVARIAGIRALFSSRQITRRCEFVNFDKIRRNRNKKSAKDLIAALKIGEWI